MPTPPRHIRMSDELWEALQVIVDDSYDIETVAQLIRQLAARAVKNHQRKAGA